MKFCFAIRFLNLEIRIWINFLNLLDISKNLLFFKKYINYNCYKCKKSSIYLVCLGNFSKRFCLFSLLSSSTRLKLNLSLKENFKQYNFHFFKIKIRNLKLLIHHLKFTNLSILYWPVYSLVFWLFHDTDHLFHSR